MNRREKRMRKFARKEFQRVFYFKGCKCVHDYISSKAGRRHGYQIYVYSKDEYKEVQIVKVIGKKVYVTFAMTIGHGDDTIYTAYYAMRYCGAAYYMRPCE